MDLVTYSRPYLSESLLVKGPQGKDISKRNFHGCDFHVVCRDGVRKQRSEFFEALH